MTERRTVKSWLHHLQDPDAMLTLAEFTALTLVHIRENVKDTTAGTQHLEGMVGSLDELMASTNPVYQQIAAKRARPTPALNGEQP